MSGACCPICMEEWDNTTHRPLVLVCCKNQTPSAERTVCATCVQAQMLHSMKCFYCPSRMQDGRNGNGFIDKCESVTPCDHLETMRKSGESCTLPKPQPAGGKLKEELELLSEVPGDGEFARKFDENERNSERALEEEDRKLAERLQREEAQSQRAAAVLAPAPPAAPAPKRLAEHSSQLTIEEMLEKLKQKKAKDAKEQQQQKKAKVVDLTGEDDDDDDDDDDTRAERRERGPQFVDLT